VKEDKIKKPPEPRIPVSILLVEDNPADERIIKELLKEAGGIECSLKSRDTLRSAIDILKKESFTMILLDLSLPDSSGLNTFYDIKDEAADSAIIIISGTDDENLALKIIERGAQDYLVKGGFDGDMLGKTVKNAVLWREL